MGVWTWIAVYVVGFGLLQLLVYRYFRDREPSVERTSPGGPESYATSLDGTERATAAQSAEGAGRHCRRCGAFNATDSAYRYCWQCVSPLE